MSDVEEIRETIAKNEKQKEYSERILNLMNNPEFSELIVGDYMTHGIDQLLEARAHPTQQTPEAIAYNNRRIDGIAMFKSWLTDQLVAGDNAEEALHELNAELNLAIEEQEGETVNG